MPTRNRTRLLASVLCPALLAAIAPSIPAQPPAPGDVDLSFGGAFTMLSGKVRPYVARLYCGPAAGSQSSAATATTPAALISRMQCASSTGCSLETPLWTPRLLCCNLDPMPCKQGVSRLFFPDDLRSRLFRFRD